MLAIRVDLDAIPASKPLFASSFETDHLSGKAER
jgi:hypothetical protein